MRAAFVGSEQAGRGAHSNKMGLLYRVFPENARVMGIFVEKQSEQDPISDRLLFNRTASPVTRMLQNRLAANRVGACHPPQRAFGAGEGKGVSGLPLGRASLTLNVCCSTTRPLPPRAARAVPPPQRASGAGEGKGVVSSPREIRSLLCVSLPRRLPTERAANGRPY